MCLRYLQYITQFIPHNINTIFYHPSSCIILRANVNRTHYGGEGSKRLLLGWLVVYLAVLCYVRELFSVR
jgi:hypothetical protein